MFSWNAGAFSALLEKATSSQLLEPDWMVIMELCDSVRSGETEAKGALAAVKKKLLSKNPNVTMLALHCLESMVKNCGHSVHKEVATYAFMHEFRNILRQHESETVREKSFELIQAWAHAFRNEPDYRAVQDMMQFMRTVEGVKFPQLKESDAMFSAQVPPEWEDSDCCHLCRTQFSTFNRKHHCRNCGQVFCGKCSSQTVALPKLGIEKKVRVCDTCFTEHGQESPTHSSPVLKSLKVSANKSKKSPAKTQEPVSKQDQGTQLKEAKLREEEEFQLALALSQSEAEYNEGKRSTFVERDVRNEAEDRGKNASYGSTVYPSEYAEANAPTRSECGSTTGSTESELTHYLDRKYWDDRSNRVGDTDTPKATSRSLEGLPPSSFSESTYLFEQALEKSLDTFVNRLRSNEMRGRPIANDSYVQTLFMQISSLHARLLQCVQETDDQRAYYEGLQDKMQQIRDARGALDSLREEHKEEERHRQEEAEKARQLQMAHKLQIMRQRKHESLQYQHHLAMMKMQEQELQFRTAVTAPMMPPMGISGSQLPGQGQVYVPQPQYPTGVPQSMLASGAIGGNLHYDLQMQRGCPPQPPISPPNNGTMTSQLPPQTTQNYYIPIQNHMTQHLQQTQHPMAQNHVTPQMVPQQLPGGVQPAFEPYNVSQMMAQLPQPPQTPLPQPCAPPQTPTPNQQDVMNLPSVPNHQPTPPVQHEAQLISFD